ncbi:hypothetical protein RDMS_11850 [Deinococcus sp. RL]|uniref:YgaP family membrane protein n=1 Tax=Deinococcus sp. RL TaxID=1489678 RepID=UPI0004DAFB9B|nr:DUF2892 domain-containing protein [Deinococcus sp. RL]KEF33509.1 hypothetical protein RDMS_11850 [Deinococcus sp. RL]
MHKNMGTTDRTLRTVVGIGLIGLAATTRGPVALASGVLAAVMLGTSAVGVCPAYVPFGIDTREEKHA